MGFFGRLDSVVNPFVNIGIGRPTLAQPRHYYSGGGRRAVVVGRLRRTSVIAHVRDRSVDDLLGNSGILRLFHSFGLCMVSI